jgi:hypothetical protein
LYVAFVSFAPLPINRTAFENGIRVASADGFGGGVSVVVAFAGVEVGVCGAFIDPKSSGERDAFDVIGYALVFECQTDFR